jgi:predicted RNA binding protein YcfA (HicA-like mRNA interferase family)
MHKNIPSLKPKELIRILSKGNCHFYIEGKGDHSLYFRYCQGKKRIVPIDMGASELSPPYVLRIFRQFGFNDNDIQDLLS